MSMTSCCDTEWSGDCEALYEDLTAGTAVVYDGEVVGINGNIGKHEKIFIKLIDESPVFKQEYYSRQADLMNTVQGMTTCYDLTGPHQLTIMTEPAGVGDDVKLNSLTIEDFPWTGDYFGNMENIIEADRKDGDYFFSHWESRSGNVITPSALEREATLNLAGADTLVAVYSNEITSTSEEELLSSQISLYPNPTSGAVTVRVELEQSALAALRLYNSMGEYIAEVHAPSNVAAGTSTFVVDLEALDVPLGIYVLKLELDENVVSKRLTYVR